MHWIGQLKNRNNWSTGERKYEDFNENRDFVLFNWRYNYTQNVSYGVTFNILF